MKKLILRMNSAFKYFKVFDVGVFKIVLISAGLLLGTFFSGFFKQNIALLWILFGVSLGYVLIKLIKYYKQVR